MSGNAARNEALSALTGVLHNELFLEDALQQHISRLPEPDAQFFSYLLRGTVERTETLTAILSKLSNTPVSKMRPVLRNLLYLGLFELLFMRTENYAAVNEYVNLAKKRGFSSLSGFVNGILRNAERKKDELTEGLSVREAISFPPFLYELLSGQYGEEILKKAGTYMLSPASKTITVRRNTSKCSEEALIALLEKEGATLTPVKISPEGEERAEFVYALSSVVPISALTAFRNGLFYVQDLSPCLSVLSAVSNIPEKTEKTAILDVCASPGGKSLAACDLCLERGISVEITACDVSEKKVAVIRDNFKWQGFPLKEARISDGTVFVPEFEEGFDLVIADVPCSGTGVLSGKPDIKLHVTRESIDGLLKIQSAILENAARYVKKGGLLLYSTCTLNREENEVQVERFLKKSGGFTDVSRETLIPGVNVFGDGFYSQLLRKEGNE